MLRCISILTVVFGVVAGCFGQEPPPPRQADPPPAENPDRPPARETPDPTAETLAWLCAAPFEGVVFDHNEARVEAIVVFRRAVRGLAGELRVGTRSFGIDAGKLRDGVLDLQLLLPSTGFGHVRKAVAVSWQIDRVADADRAPGVTRMVVYGAVPGTGVMLVSRRNEVLPAGARSAYTLMAVEGELNLQTDGDAPKLRAILYGAGSARVLSSSIRVDEATRTIRLRVVRHPASGDPLDELARHTATGELPLRLAQGNWTVEVLEQTGDDGEPRLVAAATLVAMPAR